MKLSRYSWRRFLIQALCSLFPAFFFLMIFSNPVSAEKDLPETKADLFQILGEEQALSETYLAILNQFGKKDFEKYVESIEKYGIARSKFNGLIEFIKKKLTDEEPFGQSEQFDETLKIAIEKRLAFTSFVKKEIIGNREGTRGFPKLSLGKPGEWLAAFKDVAKTLWQEYRAVQDQRRKELIEQLNALKWKPVSIQ